LGHQVDVVTPGYGAFSQLPGAEAAGRLQVMFMGGQQSVDIFRVPGKRLRENVTLWVLEHPLFAVGGEGKIYCDDPGDRPFATDASKFALFSVAVAQALIDATFAAVDVLHLHDWHAALVGVLRAFDPRYAALQSIHTVYTIHNLALQGVRPLDGDESSLHAWFPELDYAVGRLNDPRAPHCINPMRAGINLSDKVHAVSPTYAREIQLASNPEQGYFGGEGLHEDLQRAAGEGRLHGILNGCEYPGQTEPPLSVSELLLLCEKETLNWLGDKAVVESVHLIASKRLTQLISTLGSVVNATSEPFIVTSVGRITDQKVLLLRQIMPDGATALDHLLNELGDKGVFILLGSGDPGLEQFLTKVASARQNFVFLRGYAETLAECLYASGDLFLMPSSFEPCGISQMLAMRAGQPCLVHSVGGLSDTVSNGKNGFAFTGDTLQKQAENMISCFQLALQTKREEIETWENISTAAATARFLWSDVADETVRLLYGNP
ncbi:MAG: glycogen/starch synthase, partial [Gammaproteobacteria bacterium]|nr:glycogen/starch synthase [Gammaproteobacteria bacterium]